MAKSPLFRSRAAWRTSTLLTLVTLSGLLACEPSEPDPVPVEGGVQHPVREAGAAPAADAGMSGGTDSGAADAGDSEDGDR